MSTCYDNVARPVCGGLKEAGEAHVHEGRAQAPDDTVVQTKPAQNRHEIIVNIVDF